MKPQTRVVPNRALLAVAGLTLLAFVLRLRAMGQGLYGDELFTLDDTRDGLAGVFDGLDKNEANPPLFYLIAWLCAQLGDPSLWIRVPSLVFGTATVPVVYALGRRTAGRAAGLVAAALMALSPLAIFYSTEARAYATMVFLVSLSTLALLKALERGRLAWWIAYAVSACAALYTHYTAVFPVLAQALWAFWVHRERIRTLAIVHLAIAFAYIPWLPSLQQQRQKDLFVGIIGAYGHLSPGAVFDYLLRLIVGYPFRALAVIPGRAALILLGIAGATAIVGALVATARGMRQWAPPSRAAHVLVWILALATPVGLLAYGAVGDDLFNPRNLTASLPALCIVLASLVTSLRPRLALASAALGLLAVSIGTAKGLEKDNLRPASRQVAHYIDDRAARADPVEVELGFVGGLDSYFTQKHPIYQANTDDRAILKRAVRGASIFVVRGEVGSLALLPRLAGPGNRFVLREGTVYPGLRRLSVGRYAGEVRARLVRRDGRQVIAWSAGRDLAVSPDAARGFVERISSSSGGLVVTGWAIDAATHSGADWLLAFAGEHLLAISRPLGVRPDVAKAFGEPAALSGFTIETPTTGHEALADRSRLRVYAVVGDRATRLKRTEK